MIEVLADSRLKDPKNLVKRGDIWWVKIFCANCGKDGGMVPEENCNFAFYLCQPCADKWGPITNTYFEPDLVFWQKVKEAQLEKYGRELTSDELGQALKDENHFLTRLCKDRPKRGAD